MDGITGTMDMNLSKFWELVMDKKAWHAAQCGCKVSYTTETEQQQQCDTKCWYTCVLYISSQYFEYAKF